MIPETLLNEEVEGVVLGTEPGHESTVTAKLGLGGHGGIVTLDDLDLAGSFVDAKARAVARFEAVYLETLMRRCGGNLAKASREADMARNHLRDLLKRHGLYTPRPAGWPRLEEAATRLEERLAPKLPRPGLVWLGPRSQPEATP